MLNCLSGINCVCLKMTNILVEPHIDEAEDFIRRGIQKHNVLLIVGNCCVEYEGRASSKLEPGERIVIIKEDGALLIHRSTGYEPVNWMPGGNVVYHVRTIKSKEENSRDRISVNWQPPDCIFHVQMEDKMLKIHAVRRKPTESVKVFFDKFHMVSVLSLVDSGEFALYATEEDMQKAILAEPSLVEEEFKPISYERKVEPGFVDVYGMDKEGNLVVVEIKRKTAGNEAVLQLAKYVDAIRENTNRDVRGILVAPNIAKGVQTLLATIKLEFKALSPRKCAKILEKSRTRKLESFFKEK